MVTAIACRGLEVTLGGTPVLSGVDLSVEQGEWLTVVGPNGAGKSTLLRVVAGVVAGRGTVELGGRPAATLARRERAQLVALVPQAPVLPPGISVGEYVLLGRTPHISGLAVEGPRDLAAVHDALTQLDLVSFAGRALATLSGGERQRVFLARALAQGAPLVLLDEPTTALDVGHAQQVLETVDRLRRTRGLTVLSTMHDLTLAGQYADRLVLLDRGRLVISGSAEEVLTAEHLATYYGANVVVLSDGDRPVVVPERTRSRDVERA